MAADSPAIRLARTLEKLRRLKPKVILAINEDGDETRVPITGMRGRYERAGRALIASDAVTAKLLDAEGGVLEVLNIAAASSGDVASDGAPPEGTFSVRDHRERDREEREERRAAEVDDVRELVKIALDAAERARAHDLEVLRQTREQDREMVKAQTEVLQTVTTAAVGLMQTASERAERLEVMLNEATQRHGKELRALAMQLEAEREERARLAENAEGGNSADKMIERLIFGDKKDEPAKAAEESKPNGKASA